MTTFFSENFFFNFCENFFGKFSEFSSCLENFWARDSPGVLGYWVCTSIRISKRDFIGLQLITSYMIL